MPDITTDSGNVTFVMEPAGTPRQRHERLVIRCSADGEVWIAIEPAHAVRK